MRATIAQFSQLSTISGVRCRSPWPRFFHTAADQNRKEGGAAANPFLSSPSHKRVPAVCFSSWKLKSRGKWEKFHFLKAKFLLRKNFNFYYWKLDSIWNGTSTTLHRVPRYIFVYYLSLICIWFIWQSRQSSKHLSGLCFWWQVSSGGTLSHNPTFITGKFHRDKPGQISPPHLFVPLGTTSSSKS